MKKRITLLVAIIFILSSITAFAGIQASGQLSDYYITIGKSGTSVKVLSEVYGTHNNLTKIGFTTVTIYERPVGGSWSVKQTFNASYAYGTGSHNYTVSVTGRSGYQYYATSDVYGNDSNGTTQRSMTSSTLTW